MPRLRNRCLTYFTEDKSYCHGKIRCFSNKYSYLKYIKTMVRTLFHRMTPNSINLSYANLFFCKLRSKSEFEENPLSSN